jgi:RNA polymerase sigma factor (sigma-70 family)
LTIVANVARSRRATAARRPTLTLQAAATLPSDDSAQSPEAVALVAEQRRELLGAVNALRDDDQRVIAYRYFLDLSEVEMAAVLGCARGTVKSRLSRALGRLRQQLVPGAPAPGEGECHD